MKNENLDKIIYKNIGQDRTRYKLFIIFKICWYRCISQTKKEIFKEYAYRRLLLVLYVFKLFRTFK